jgi:hypothetical protein
MAKMTIIEVDLSKDISDIIDDDIMKINDEAQETIQEAIETQIAINTKKKPKSQQNLKEEAIRAALEKVFQGLLAVNSGKGFLTIDEVLELADPAISNSSALITRLNTYLRKEKNSSHVIKRTTRQGKSTYSLTPFNVMEE